MVKFIAEEKVEMTFAQIILDDDVINFRSTNQMFDQFGPDISGSTGDEYFHITLLNRCGVHTLLYSIQTTSFRALAFPDPSYVYMVHIQY